MTEKEYGTKENSLKGRQPKRKQLKDELEDFISKTNSEIQEFHENYRFFSFSLPI